MNYYASNAAQLKAALTKAVGGDLIRLAGGDYGDLDLSGVNFSSAVTIASASGYTPAHFDHIRISRSNNIFFRGLDIGEATPEGVNPEFQALNSVRNSTNIRFTNSTFHGTRDGVATNDGTGLIIADSTNVGVYGSKFDNVYRGITMFRVTNGSVVGNDFQDIRVDGMAVAAGTRIVIDGNRFSNFRSLPEDHSDAIQFWNTNETRGSTYVTIQNNVAMQGNGTGFQGLFIASPGAYGYENFTIRNNLFYNNDRWNGMMIDGGRKMLIEDNTILSAQDDASQHWIRLKNTSNMTVRDNVVDSIWLESGNTSVVQQNNLLMTNTGSALVQALADQALNPTSAAQLQVVGYGYQAPPSSLFTSSAATIPLPQSTAEPVVAVQSDFASTAYESAPVAMTVSAPFYHPIDSFVALP